MLRCEQSLKGNCHYEAALKQHPPTIVLSQIQPGPCRQTLFFMRQHGPPSARGEARRAQAVGFAKAQLSDFPAGQRHVGAEFSM